MGKLICSECGHEFDSLMDSCPNCGCPNFDKNNFKKNKAEKWVLTWRDKAMSRKIGLFCVTSVLLIIEIIFLVICRVKNWINISSAFLTISGIIDLIFLSMALSLKMSFTIIDGVTIVLFRGFIKYLVVDNVVVAKRFRLTNVSYQISENTVINADFASCTIETQKVQ